MSEVYHILREGHMRLQSLWWKQMREQVIFYSKAAAQATHPLPTFPGLRVQMSWHNKDGYDERVPTTRSEAIQIFHQFKESQQQYDPQRDEWDIFYESIPSTILHYNDTLNSKFLSSSPSLFMNELGSGDDTFDFEMWQPSPDIPDIDAQTDEPEDIPEPQAPVDTQNPESVDPQASVDTQASSKQTSFDLGPSILPMLDQNKDQDGELTWKQPTVPQSNTFLMSIVHTLLLEPLLSSSGATVELWKINFTLTLVFPCWIMNCHALMMP